VLHDFDEEATKEGKENKRGQKRKREDESSEEERKEDDSGEYEYESESEEEESDFIPELVIEGEEDKTEGGFKFDELVEPSTGMEVEDAKSEGEEGIEGVGPETRKREEGVRREQELSMLEDLYDEEGEEDKNPYQENSSTSSTLPHAEPRARPEPKLSTLGDLYDGIEEEENKIQHKKEKIPRRATEEEVKQDEGVVSVGSETRLQQNEKKEKMEAEALEREEQQPVPEKAVPSPSIPTDGVQNDLQQEKQDETQILRGALGALLGLVKQSEDQVRSGEAGVAGKEFEEGNFLLSVFLRRSGYVGRISPTLGSYPERAI
jgi:hypothetical protein